MYRKEHIGTRQIWDFFYKKHKTTLKHLTTRALNRKQNLILEMVLKEYYEKEE